MNEIFNSVTGLKLSGTSGPGESLVFASEDSSDSEYAIVPELSRLCVLLCEISIDCKPSIDVKFERSICLLCYHSGVYIALRRFSISLCYGVCGPLRQLIHAESGGRMKRQEPRCGKSGSMRRYAAVVQSCVKNDVLPRYRMILAYLRFLVYLIGTDHDMYICQCHVTIVVLW